MLSSKDSLAVLKKTNALLEGHFILSSGLHSSQYIQCAKLLSYPKHASKICKSLSQKIKKNFKKVDLILSPAIGGIVIGYEIGKLLNKETIFCERVKGKFNLRRGFSIKKNSKVLIVEDVITTGKSSLECVKLIKKFNARILGFACIIDRSDKKNLKIKNKKIITQLKIKVATYKKKELPSS
jgi:orotate phosphoribosyltransferase, Thermus family